MPKVKGKMKEEIELDCTKIKGVYSLKKKKITEKTSWRPEKMKTHTTGKAVMARIYKELLQINHTGVDNLSF